MPEKPKENSEAPPKSVSISPRLQKVLDVMERESKKPAHKEVLKETSNYIVIKTVD